MGDVLTGVIGALLAQGCTLEEAAVCGVEVHARAGDAAACSAPRGLLASDLLPALRAGVNP
jgi:NAD(P)H-hydrate epimerase